MTLIKPKDPATIWAIWRRLYPVYNALAADQVIPVHPCPELEHPIDAPPAEVIAEAGKWFTRMDERIQVHQLRQFAQTSTAMNEEALRDFTQHHLNKKPHTDQDRDKVDFLLVQLFSLQAPQHATEADLSIRAVAKALEPVIGPVEVTTPEFVKPLNELLQEASRTKSLKALFTLRIIERGREIKSRCRDRFFDPLTLTAFARFGFLLRRTFFRLMHQDLNTILEGLRELETRGVTTLDCRKAQYAADEPTSRLRVICQSWRVMFQAEYSSGQPMCILVDLKTAVDLALAKSRVSPAKAQAAAAGAAAGAGAKAAGAIGSATIAKSGAAAKAGASSPAQPQSKVPLSSATKGASIPAPKPGRQK